MRQPACGPRVKLPIGAERRRNIDGLRSCLRRPSGALPRCGQGTRTTPQWRLLPWKTCARSRSPLPTSGPDASLTHPPDTYAPRPAAPQKRALPLMRGTFARATSIAIIFRAVWIKKVGLPPRAWTARDLDHGLLQAPQEVPPVVDFALARPRYGQG